MAVLMGVTTTFASAGVPVRMPTPAAVAATAYIQSLLSSFELTAVWLRVLRREEGSCIVFTFRGRKIGGHVSLALPGGSVNEERGLRDEVPWWAGVCRDGGEYQNPHFFRKERGRHGAPRWSTP